MGGEGAIYFWAKLPDRFAGPVNITTEATATTNGIKAATDGVNGAAAMRSSTEDYAGTDEDVVAWLIKEHGVCVIPGSACGAPGYIRVAYANITPQQCEQAATRLRAGLQQLIGLDSVLPTQ